MAIIGAASHLWVEKNRPIQDTDGHAISHIFVCRRQKPPSPRAKEKAADVRRIAAKNHPGSSDHFGNAKHFRFPCRDTDRTVTLLPSRQIVAAWLRIRADYRPPPDIVMVWKNSSSMAFTSVAPRGTVIARPS